MGEGAFANCYILRRITIPLKYGLFADNDVFIGCDRLRQVDLVEGKVLQDTVEALLIDEWKNYMNAAIGSINGILSNASAGFYDAYDFREKNGGGKTEAIRKWISSVLGMIIHYKAQHRRLMMEAATILSDVLSNDMVINHVLPFLALPSHTFHGEDDESVNLFNSD